MTQEQSIQQQLEAAQAQIQQLSQQLATERNAAHQTQARLQGQLEQQQQQIAQLEGQTNRLQRQPTEPLVEQDLQPVAQENRPFRQTLEAQEVTYRHLFDCNPQPMWVYDLETLRFLAVNDAAVVKYGYSRGEFLAMTIADIRPPEDMPRLLANVAQVDSGLDLAGTWQHCLKDGQIIQVEIVSYALEFEGRRAELVMAQDITDRIRAEQALRQSEERYRQLIELSPYLIWNADADGQNTYASPQMCRYIGLPAEQLLNLDWQRVIHPEDAERVHTRWMQSVQSGMAYETEYRLRRADGVYRWHLVQAVCVQPEQDGQWFGLSTDIHDRKQAELTLQDLNRTLEQKVAERTAELRQSQAELQSVLNHSPAKIYVENLDGHYIFVNQTFLDLFGCTPAEILGKTIYEVFPPDIADAFRANDRLLLSQGGVQQFEEIVWVNGEERVFLSNKFLLRDDQGEAYALCGMSTDITDLKEIESRLTRQLAAIEAAVDGIAITQNNAFLYLNRAHLELFGYTQAAELIGQPWTVLYGPTELARFEQEIMPILARDGAWSGDVLATRQDGSTFDQWLSLTLTEDELVICVCEDISDRKAAERALQASQTLLQTVLETVPIAIFWKDRKGVYQGANSKIESIFGVTATDLVNRTDAELIWPPDVVEIIQAEDRQIIATGEACLNIAQHLITTTGVELWLEINKVPFCDAEGNIIGVLGTAKDISDRKRQALALEAYANEVEDLYNNAPCGYHSLDTSGRITRINNTELVWLGYPREAVVGQPITQFLTQASRAVFAERWAMLNQSRQTKTMQYQVTLLGSDGGHIEVLFSEQLQTDAHGNRIGSRTTVVDIRQRLKAESMLQRQFQQEALLRQVTDRIRQSLELTTVFNTACNEVRQTLQVDRVAIFKFYSETSFTDGEFIAESMVADYPSIVSIPVHDHCFGQDFATLYVQGRYYATADIESSDLSPCHSDILRQFQVRANLVVPLIRGDRVLWGLLCVHQCSGSYTWRTSDIELTQQIAHQLEIAINQANLYRRLQVELQVRQQVEAQIIQQLQQQRTFAILTETIRASLDIDHILATVTQQVKDLLRCDRVIIFRLFPDGHSRIVEEAVAPEFASLKGQQWDDEVWSPDILETYWQGQPRIVSDVMNDVWTDCLVDYSQAGHIQSKIVAPILQEAHGQENHRWVASHHHNQLWGIIVAHACREQRMWQESEAELLQQIANKLAIAIQQAGLFTQLQQELSERQQIQQDLIESNQRLEIANQELMRATRLKDEFLANMSHELRTPLNAILGMAEGLQDEVFGPISDRQQKPLKTIERSGTHLLSLINDILDVAKIEAGQFELDYTSVNVNYLCQSSLSFVKQQANKKRLRLETQMPNGLPDLYGDERRLRQVLINLLTNAVKFTPETGCITITTSYRPLNSEGVSIERRLLHPQAAPSATTGILSIAVADTGIGISPEQAKKLFQPFMQVDSALNRQHEGTGLGLALVKRITELHGGEVELSSEVGVGSCFTLWLPVTMAASVPFSQAETAHSREADLSIDAASDYLILLAEDNEANINTTTAYLSAKGYQLIVARNGHEALQLANSALPDLIVMDIQMPQLNGLEAIRQIRQHPDLATVPIVALTALAMPDDCDRCLSAGANEYISKPIRLKHLHHVIQTLLTKPAME
ncbi:MAG: PAS domain S-box protein [Thainema sp.]